MAKTINSIESEKKKVIKNMNEKQLEEYYKILIANLYEGFVTLDKEKALGSKALIEEATSIYKQNYGYRFIDRMEYHLRLKEANKQLTKSLEEKNRLHITIVEDYYVKAIDIISIYSSVLETLLNTYEKRPSKELASTMKTILFSAESEIEFKKQLLDIDPGTEYFSEEVDFLKELYSDFETLSDKIKKL